MPTPHQVDGSRFLKDNSVTGSKLTAGAQSTVLQSALRAARDLIANFSFPAALSADVTTVVQAAATTFTPITALTARGVYTGAVSNAASTLAVQIRLTGTNEQVNDGNGGNVYGVLTQATGVYTLSTYKEDGTTYTFSAPTAIDFYFVEVFDLSTIPVDAGLRDVGGGAVDVSDATVIAQAAALVPANYTPLTQTLKGQFQGLDSALAAAGLAHKEVVAVATATVPGTYNNGTAGVGATITATTNGAFPAQDGVSISVGMRVLLPFQSAPADNGIFTLTQVGDGGHPYILTRAVDFNTPATMQSGALIPVAAGGLNYGSVIYKLEAAPTNVGVDALTFDTIQVLPTFLDSVFKVVNASDPTKGTKVDASGLTAGATRTVHLADRDVTLDNVTQEITDVITLTTLMVTNKSVTLSQTPKIAANTKLNVDGGIPQRYSLDYSVTGAVLSWTGLGLDGTLIAGDVLRVNYLYNG
jgi:hypothetical protein